MTKQPKEVLFAIDSFIHDNSLMPSDEASEFVEKIMMEPNYMELRRSYAKRLLISVYAGFAATTGFGLVSRQKNSAT